MARPRQRAGNIVNIVANVWRGMPQVAHTCAARAGVIYLTKTVATEWAPLGIRVNCVSPGSIATEGLNVYPGRRPERFRELQPDAAHSATCSTWPRPSSISPPDTGKFITGEVLVVDGGNNQVGRRLARRQARSIFDVDDDLQNRRTMADTLLDPDSARATARSVIWPGTH